MKLSFFYVPLYKHAYIEKKKKKKRESNILCFCPTIKQIVWLAEFTIGFFIKLHR